MTVIRSLNVINISQCAMWPLSHTKRKSWKQHITSVTEGYSLQRISWKRKNKIRNEEVIEKTSLQKLVLSSRKQDRWFGHVADGRWQTAETTSQVMHSEANTTKRRAGRQKKGLEKI